MYTSTLTTCNPALAPAYLANGLVGLRVAPFPLQGGIAYLNGYVGLSAYTALEGYAEAPYPLEADLCLNRRWLSARPDLATFQEQAYDFSCGELTSCFTYAADSVTAQVEVLIFCSRTLPAVVLQEIRVRVDAPCTLVLRALMNPQHLAGTQRLRSMPDGIADAVLLWESRGGLSTCGTAFITEYVGDDLAKTRRNDWGYEEDTNLKEYTVDAQPGKDYVLRQYGALIPGLMHAEPHWQAMRMLGLATWQGFDKIRADNRAAWADLWQGRVVLLGAESKWQEVLDASYFYLHSTIHQTTPCSVAPFGLGQKDIYSGHVFWDTETFMFPPVLLTAPHAARTMLDYRSRQLQAAKFNAAMNGYRGVQFPWQSSNHGGEVTSVWARGGITEQHVNMDVAFAFAQYAHATGDELFIRQQAWPVLEGVAEWIISRVTKTARGYEIRHITGPDELLDNVHNNAYTNLTAIVVLREAAGMARRMGFTPPPAWEAVAEGMFVPIDPATNVILKHDAYRYESGMCVPETLGAFFPFTYRHTPEVEQATVRYHLDLAHTYMGLPMFSALLGVYAARLGQRELSRDIFAEGIFPHVVEPFMNFTEVAGNYADLFSGSSTTPFLTNPAGFLMACLYGLTGLQLGPGDPQSWAVFPITLPAGWDGIEVARIFAHGQPVKLQAMHGAERAIITPA